MKRIYLKLLKSLGGREESRCEICDVLNACCACWPYGLLDHLEVLLEFLLKWLTLPSTSSLTSPLSYDNPLCCASSLFSPPLLPSLFSLLTSLDVPVWPSLERWWQCFQRLGEDTMLYNKIAKKKWKKKGEKKEKKRKKRKNGKKEGEERAEERIREGIPVPSTQSAWIRPSKRYPLAFLMYS